MLKIDLLDLSAYLFQDDLSLQNYILGLTDEKIMQVRLSHYVAFEKFVKDLKLQEPLTLTALKSLLKKQSLEIRFLFSYTYSMLLSRNTNLQKFNSISEFLIAELITNNPEHIHYLDQYR